VERHSGTTGAGCLIDPAFRYAQCGLQARFLTANLAYALARTDLGPEFRKEAKRLLGED